MWLTYIASFLSGFILDFLWIWWLSAAKQGKKIEATLVSAALMATSAFGIKQYVQNSSSLFFLMFGCMLGTFLSMCIFKSE